MYLMMQNSLLENRYKHEAMVDGEPILFEILDTCPKVVPIPSIEFSLIQVKI